MATKDFVSVITGAASGIGLSLSQSCLALGHKVVMVDCDAVRLNEQSVLLERSYPSQLLAVSCDVTDFTGLNDLVETVYKTFGFVHWLFNNAGVSGKIRPAWELSAEDFKAVIEVNILGVTNVVTAFMPKLIQQGQASRIINVSSLYGLCSSAFLSAYALTKSAVLSYSESLFYDLSLTDYPVDVSVVCPSLVNTNLIATDDNRSPKDALQRAMQSLMEHSRSPKVLADAIIEALHEERFYIIPDSEAHSCFQKRSAAIQSLSFPPNHVVQKLMTHAASDHFQTRQETLEEPL